MIFHHYRIRDLIFAVITTIGIRLPLTRIDLSQDGWNKWIDLLRMKGSFSTTDLLILAGILLLYHKAGEVQESISSLIVYCIPSALFSFFMIEGHRIDTADGIGFFTPGKFYLVPCVLSFISWFFLSLAVFLLSDHLLSQDHMDTLRTPAPMTRYLQLLEKHPFLTSFVTLLLLYTPYIILSYPGIFMGDTPDQIPEAFNLSGYHPYMDLLDDSIKLNNHHPVTHTMLLHICIVGGIKLFSSWNAGIFLYSSVQILFTLCAYSACILILLRKRMVSGIGAACILLWFACHPRIQSYLMLVSKDTMYTSFLLFFLCGLYCLVTDQETWRFSYWACFFCCITGVVLFRNDGIYIIAGTLAVLLFFSEYRRRSVLLLASVIVFSVFWNSFFLPHMKISPGSVREVLSVPLQQTARYMKDCPSDLTDTERTAISGVIDPDKIAAVYDPNTADPVKELFRRDVNRQELSAYLKTWLYMLQRHPGICLNAFLENKHRFFYPDTIPAYNYRYRWGADCMDAINQWYADELGSDFHFPNRLWGIRTAYEQLRENVFSSSVFGIILSSASYVWLTVFFICYSIKKRRGTAFVFLTPMILQILICMAAPTNGEYFRYVYPISVCLIPCVCMGRRR